MKEFYSESPDNDKETPANDFHKLYSNAYGENFESRRANLNEQYDRPEVIKVKDKNGKETGETIEVIDIKPDNMKDEVPLVYFKGFSSGNEAYRNLLVELGMLGNRVIAMENPHGIDSSRITEEEKNLPFSIKMTLPISSFAKPPWSWKPSRIRKTSKRSTLSPIPKARSMR